MEEKMDENERFRIRFYYGKIPYLRDNFLNMNIPNSIANPSYIKLLNHYENRISDLEKQISILKQEMVEK